MSRKRLVEIKETLLKEKKKAQLASNTPSSTLQFLNLEKLTYTLFVFTIFCYLLNMIGKDKKK